MKNYGILLFDLDGTLTDPVLGITNAVMHALDKYGIPRPERRELHKFIGPPLTWSFENYYGFSPEKAMEAVGHYREYFQDKGLYENEIYPGIADMLAKLKAAGKTLCVATSKPELFAKKILEYFHIDGYFDHVCGACMDESRGTKHLVIEYALEQCGSPERSNVLMIGDREHDVIGAKQSGLDCLGILYGYGDRQELESAGAAYIAESVEDLCAQLMI